MDSELQMAMILDIAERASTNEKKMLAKRLDPRILKYAYHPFIKFYMKPPPPQHSNWVKGSNIGNLGFRVLDLLSTGKFRGQKALNLYHEYERSLNQPSAELFHRMVTKDLRCGISVKTVRELHPGLIPEEFCMLCSDLDWSRVSFPCYVSPKIDGDRGLYRDGRILSRSGRSIDGLGHIVEAIKKLGPNVEYGLDGELIDLTKSFSKSSGALRSGNDKSLYVFWVFDLLVPDMSFELRYRWLRNMIFATTPVDNHTPLAYVPHLIARSQGDIEQYYRQFLTMGFEGAVIKSPHHPYQYKRSKDWMRLVPEATADLRAIRLIEGKGKDVGSVGAIEVNFKGQLQKVGPGRATDEQRIAWWNDPSLILGRTIEIIYKGETDHHKMRQARFVKIRYDK